MVSTSARHSAFAACATFCSILPFFDAICDLLLNRRTARQHGIHFSRNEQKAHMMRDVLNSTLFEIVK